MVEAAVRCADSVTAFTAEARGSVLVTGSHTGLLVAAWALSVGAAGLIANDAGVGKQGAGVAGLDLLNQFGVPGVAVDVWSARIGDGADTLDHGRVSTVNECASQIGVLAGMRARDVAELMAGRAPMNDAVVGTDRANTQGTVLVEGPVRVIVLDSAGWIDARHDGSIIVTGSHGGVVAGRAVKAKVGAAVFNDAGVGKQQAGVGRLALLDSMGIAGFTVSHLSARIGDALDTYTSGEVSCVNAKAAELGVEVSMQARDAVDLLARVTRKDLI